MRKVKTLWPALGHVDSPEEIGPNGSKTVRAVADMVKAADEAGAEIPPGGDPSPEEVPVSRYLPSLQPPRADDEVVAVVQLRHKPGNILRRMRKVGVHLDDRFSSPARRARGQAPARRLRPGLSSPRSATGR